MGRGDNTGTQGRKRALLVLLGLGLAACGGGWVREDGVASQTIWAKARGVDGTDVQLFVPADAFGAARGPHRALVFSPGGFVDPARYAWLGRALAKRGFAVAIPTYPLQLGFFSADNLEVARRVLVEGDAAANVHPLAEPGSVVVAGHSLGGVVAAGAAVDGNFAALVLLASFAAAYEPVESLAIPVLSIAGAADCNSLLADVKAGARRFSSGLLYGEIAGLTHYGFTDSLAEDEAAGCASGIALADGHARLAQLIDTFVQARLERDPIAAQALAAGFPGVVLTEKP